MKPRLQLLALGALALLLVLGLGLVFQRRLARDLYPPYSSFRADPLGARAWHDALASLPGFHVERSLVPPEKLRPAGAATLFFVGSSRHDWTAMPAEDFAALNSALTRGARVVICLAAERYAPTSELERDAAARDKLKEERLEKEKHDRIAPEPAAEPAEDTDPAHPPKPAKTAPKRPPPVDAFARWGLKIELQRDHSGRLAAQDVDDLAPPPDLRWESSLVVAPDDPAQWTVVLARDEKPLWGEHAVGAGTLVVLTDSFLVSNEALQRARATALLVRLAGPHRRVVFDEHHLGVAASPGIAALARRYGLMPAFALCVLLAGLYVWRIGAAFVPPTPASAETALDYRPTSSLAALLRRAVPAKQLLPTCLAEWRRTARPGDSARADAALAGHAEPVSGYNAVVAALRRRSVTPVSKH
ncbi:MAG TPA: DUF4350 domain-containing protein [Opitutaceae bacterium]|nr:DUF4350 domain-containing protein [Opitutaceae bacterium]